MVHAAASANPTARVEVEILEDAESFSALADSWADLATRAANVSAPQTLEFAAQSWAHRDIDTARLCLVAAYQDGRLQGIWPLYSAKTRGEVRIRNLGFEGHEEYASPLLAAGDETVVFNAMFAVAARLGDLLEIYNIPEASPVNAALKAAKGATWLYDAKSPLVSLREGAGWDAWLSGKSKSFRSGLRYDRRRLEGLGTVAFSEVTKPEVLKSFIDWFLAEKARWLADHRIRSSWLLRPSLPQFLRAIAARPESRVKAFGLQLDGRWIAGCVGFLGADRLEYFATAFAPDMAAYSPGNLLVEECVKWCIARRLDFDFRVTIDPYKLRWSDRIEIFQTFMVPGSLRGRVELKRRQALRILDAWVYFARRQARKFKRWLRRN